MRCKLMSLTRSAFFFYYWYGDHRDLHSFPTRRSSDLSSRARCASSGPNASVPLDGRRCDRAGEGTPGAGRGGPRSEEHTSELQSRGHLVCRLLLEKKKKTISTTIIKHITLRNVYHSPR